MWAFSGAPSRATQRVFISRVWGELTVPVITQVDQLVAPLGENAQRVLDKRDDDQEPADRGKVPVGENTVSEDSRSLVWGWCCVCVLAAAAATQSQYPRGSGCKHTASQDRTWYPASPQSCWSARESHRAGWGRWWHRRCRDHRTGSGGRGCSPRCHGFGPWRKELWGVEVTDGGRRRKEGRRSKGVNTRWSRVYKASLFRPRCPENGAKPVRAM